MEKTKLNSFLDQKKPVSHLFYALVTLIIIFIVAIKNPGTFTVSRVITFFLLGMLQMEIFIFTARMIFRRFDTTTPGKEFTRLVLQRFFLFISICFLAALVVNLLFSFAATLAGGGDTGEAIGNFFRYEFKVWFKSIIGGLSFGAIIFIIIQWQDALKREQKLREENLVFQNETLKNQVNPHFLFNSLNTISSLISTNQGEAERYISRLSSIYRYILENVRKEKISLSAELDYIKNYIRLHQVGDGEKIRLRINIADAGGLNILPVSLQILVENAIKHNKATREHPLTIDVGIEDGCVVVKNNLQKMAMRLESTGTGLKNLGERIRLSTGRTLDIYENDEFFIVKVPLL